MSILRFRSLGRLLLLFLLFASTASAWELDNCGRDFRLDTDAAVADCNVGGGNDIANIDACGHCSHASAHLLGLASGTAGADRAGAVEVARISNLIPTPFSSLLFHPPRRTSSIA